MAEAGGGRFRTGFISAGAAQLAAPWNDGLDPDTDISPVRVMVAATVGGDRIGARRGEVRQRRRHRRIREAVQR